MSGEQNGNAPRHPIRVASGRTGLPQDVLRAWERRYDAVVPHRTETGRRLYSDRDLQRLQLLRRAVDSGRRISDVASLPVDELRSLVQEDPWLPGGSESPRSNGAGRPAGHFVATALDAVRDLDSQRLENVLADASLDLTPAHLRSDVIQPLLAQLGDAWRSGSLRIAHEHLATDVVRSFLGSLRLGHHVPPGAPSLVLAAPAGQRHELGALVAAIAALEIGWDAVHLGADLPAAEIAAAVRQKEARAVALSLVAPAADPTAVGELRELRRLLGSSIPIFVGGPVVHSYDAILTEIGGQELTQVSDLQTALVTLLG